MKLWTACILIHILNTVTTCSCSSISFTVPYVSDASPCHTVRTEISVVCKFRGFHGHLQIQWKFNSWKFASLQQLEICNSTWHATFPRWTCDSRKYNRCLLPVQRKFHTAKISTCTVYIPQVFGLTILLIFRLLSLLSYQVSTWLKWHIISLVVKLSIATVHKQLHGLVLIWYSYCNSILVGSCL